MSKYPSGFYALLVLSLFAGVSALGASVPLSLILKAPQGNTTLNDKIVLEIYLKNNSGRSITLEAPNGPSQAEFVYKFDVRDEKGRSILKTPYGKTVYGEEGDQIIVSSSHVISLDSGSEKEDRVWLNKIYMINSPGKYTVRASREIPKEAGGGTVSSNAVTFTVTR